MSSTFLGSMIEYYGELSQKAIQRLNAARTKINKGEYGADALTSDALGTWLDAVDGWWDSALRPVASSLPVAFWRLQVGDAATPQITLPVRLTQAGNPTSSNLVAPAAVLNTANHVSASFVGAPPNVDRTKLDVQVRNLRQHNGQPNTNAPAGLYQGFVYVDQTAVAQIVVLILP